MPLQNRVTPFGEIVAAEPRGTLMGNRGCLHNEHRQLVRTYRRSYKLWVCCRLEFNGRKRVLMSPRKYTELFFLDEAVALAAGHRPCGECRREAYKQFKSAWIAGNPSASESGEATIKQIDHTLHSERLSDSGGQRSFEATATSLPDGTFVRPSNGQDPFLLWQGRMHRWTFEGYQESIAVDAAIVEVLTPYSLVETFRMGYVPLVHCTCGIER